MVHSATGHASLQAQDRAVAKSSEWRTEIQAVDRETLQHLRQNIVGGFDEERFGACVGFGNLKRWASRHA